MGGFRFSITTGFIVMTLVCVGLWAYVNQSDWAANIAYTGYFCFLCLATGGAWVLKDERRLFWLGFAVFGWAYWFVGFDVSLSGNRMQQINFFYTGNQQQPSTGPRLITSDLLDLAETYLSDSKQVGAVVMAVWRNGGMYRGKITQITDDGQYVVQWDDNSAPQTTPGSQVFPTKTHSRVAGHSILGSLLALVGGIAVACLFGSKEERRVSLNPALPAVTNEQPIAWPKEPIKGVPTAIAILIGGLGMAGLSFLRMMNAPKGNQGMYIGGIVGALVGSAIGMYIVLRRKE